MVCNKKRKPVFIKQKWNHVVFSRATILLFHPVEGSYRSCDLYTTGQLVDGLQQKKRKPVFFKRKWNHDVFSRAIILSFHHVYLLLKIAFATIMCLLLKTDCELYIIIIK